MGVSPQVAESHPFATTGFPMAGSAQVQRAPREQRAGLGHIGHKWRLPATSHESNRLLVCGHAPECVEDSISQWPTIHRLLQRRPIDESIGRASGVRAAVAPLGRRSVNQRCVMAAHTTADGSPRRDSAMAVSITWDRTDGGANADREWLGEA